MNARNYVLSYVAQNPESKDAIIACLDSGMGWEEVALIIQVSLRDELRQAVRAAFR